jgi:hypothetical protein
MNYKENPLNGREVHKAAIRAAKEQLKTAGPHHRRDLLKHIHRMQKELLIYDKYQQAAKAARG